MNSQEISELYEKKNKDDTRRRMVAHFVILIAFAVCFLSTTSALIEPYIALDNNVYQTGEIRLNLNDGMAIINPDEYNFEPGMTVEKSFFVENVGSWEAYYRVYLDEIQGSLATVLDVTLKNVTTGDKLYQGKLSGLTKDAMELNNKIAVDEKHIFKITFHYPEDEDNATQGKDVTFVIKADATQTKNNSNAES